MIEEKKDAWLNYLALTTVIFAVCATLSTFKGGGFSTKSVITQAQASDAWAYYQSKGIKSYIYQLQSEKLELDLISLKPDASSNLSTIYTDKIADYKKKIEKYEKEKTEAQEKAKTLEAVRDEAQIHSKAFGIAVIYLQIAILLSSIAGLLKKKVVWFGGVAAGLVGLVYFADGFLVFI
jgi:hypothetical protein